MADLTTFGWDEFFESSFESFRKNGYTAGRVALEHKNLLRIYTQYGDVLAEISGGRSSRASRASVPDSSGATDDTG